MTLEYQLIQKAYYEMFINKHENVHPIRALGEAFQEEQQKNVPDLSYIRFAQGEVYFHNKDFEAAIFKWENIVNELEPWAKKNTADAYYELGLLPNAEDIYKSIVTDNSSLKTEIALQLFSLYIDRGKLDAALKVIKNTVASNPDYPHVTDIARTFFEEQQDWNNAIELAVNEGLRTESMQWFDSIQTYVDKGLTKSLYPDYFSKVLLVLYGLDRARFEKLTSSIWNSYKNENSYFVWLKEINYLLINIDIHRNDSGHELSRIFKETYFELIDGTYILERIQEIIPQLLANWLRFTDSSQAILASTAVLSWSELFPLSIHESVISDAEALFGISNKNTDQLKECLQLLDSIVKWTEAHEMGKYNRFKWLSEQLLDFNTQYILVTGTNSSGMSTFVNTFSRNEIWEDFSASSMVILKDSSDVEICEITDRDVVVLTSISDFNERMNKLQNDQESIIELKGPSPCLCENGIALMITPEIDGNYTKWEETIQYRQLADTIVFVLDTNGPLTEKDQSILTQLKKQAPYTPLHLILMDSIGKNQETDRYCEEIRLSINSYLPNAKVVTFSSINGRDQQQNVLKEYIQSIKNDQNLEDKRLEKLLFLIRSTISSLLQNRIEAENQLIESIHWNEELVFKLNGALHQVSDLEVEKIKVIKRLYGQIKEEIQNDIKEAVPKLLKECSNLINENSNFSYIHIELNEEMNKRIQNYLQSTILPKYYRSLLDWIDKSREKFDQAQFFLDEMANGFNTIYGEERISFICDFKVLEDWKRDANRMTSGFQMDKLNILLRRTPSQLILKGAGKLFGSFSQNNMMLCTKMKEYVENEDYMDTTNAIIKKFLQQFELFENALEREIGLFFQNSLDILYQADEEARLEMKENQEALENMNSNPESYHDPLKLFEVRLRQFEWLTVDGRGIQPIY